jgi:uncharacterized protein YjbJ (UPF0337 family)
MTQRRTTVSNQEPFADKADRLGGPGEESTGQVRDDQDLEAEGKQHDSTSKVEGLAEKAKEKGEELLDKISGPDVPPSLTDQEKRP